MFCVNSYLGRYLISFCIFRKIKKRRKKKPPGKKGIGARSSEDNLDLDEVNKFYILLKVYVHWTEINNQGMALSYSQSNYNEPD